jgi:hypothetical protein
MTEVEGVTNSEMEGAMSESPEKEKLIVSFELMFIIFRILTLMLSKKKRFWKDSRWEPNVLKIWIMKVL